jgi:hypothetical protein
MCFATRAQRIHAERDVFSTKDTKVYTKGTKPRLHHKSLFKHLEDRSQNIILMTEHIVGVTGSHTDN